VCPGKVVCSPRTHCTAGAPGIDFPTAGCDAGTTAQVSRMAPFARWREVEESIGHINEFITHLDFEAYKNDLKTQIYGREAICRFSLNRPSD
jgi:hypothetical protein